MSQDTGAGDDTATDGRGEAPLRTVRAAQDRPELAPGTRIDRYIVERELGAGGMGVVVAARDAELDRRIAIKLMHGPVAGSQVRLLREGQAIARLHHPNVIAVHDVGMHEGGMFIAMELVEGGTLRRWLAEPRTWREVLAVFVQIGRGLAAAHAAGLIHRDVKPENVLLDDAGRVVVTDFGLARASDDDVSQAPRDSQSAFDLDLTKTGVTLGTPAYMSPEQFRHGPIDARSDQFSFCVALFEALHGARPFERGTFEELRDAVLAGRISAVPRREVPARVQRVVMRGLAVAPAARFPTMDALVDALGAAARRPRWPWLAVPVVAAAMFTVHSLAAAPAGIACDHEPSLLAGRWDIPARVALAARLGSGATAQDRTAITKVFAAYDDHARTIAELQRTTCERRARDEIGAYEAAVIDSCLMRRAIEIGVSWRGIVIDRAASPVAVESDAEWTLPPESCREVDAPAMTAVAAVVESLYERALRPPPLDATSKESALQRATILEQDCDRAGEPELAAIVASQIAGIDEANGDLSVAKRAYESVYRRALAIHDGNRAVLALLGESWETSLTGDRAGARVLAHAAQEQAERSFVSGRTRARLYMMLGKSDKFAGDLAGAAAALQSGLDFVARDGRDLRTIEYSLRYDLIDTLAGIDGKTAAALAFARASLAQTRTLFGERSYRFAEMRDMLAIALDANGAFSDAVAERRAALELGREIHDSDRWLVDTGIALGRDLCTLGHWREALDEVMPIRDHVEQTADLHPARPDLYGAIACATLESGDVGDAVRLYGTAVDESIAQYGEVHPSTTNLRLRLAEAELEGGELADVERQLAAIDASYRERSTATPSELASLHGDLDARLALARGNPKAAEALARDALAKLGELAGVKDDQREAVQLALATSLVAQHRFADARELLDRARATGVALHQADADLARIDVQLARVEAGTGHAADALARVRTARAVLATIPGLRIENRDVVALLAQLGDRSR